MCDVPSNVGDYCATSSLLYCYLEFKISCWALVVNDIPSNVGDYCATSSLLYCYI